jgi:hypothetical protein
MCPQEGTFKQEGAHLEREALHRLPAILADLLDTSVPDRIHEATVADRGIDATLPGFENREWFFEIKASSAPGVVSRAADELFAFLSQHHSSDAIGTLVVPYMTPAGARTAHARGLNWIDLSGNAWIRAKQLFVSREGRPNAFPARGRPASAFAPVSARVARELLADPARWWRQKDLAARTGLDDGRISKIVRRLDDDLLLERQGPELRPANPDLLLDAWTDAYRFDRHDIVLGHASGGGMELARTLSEQLESLGISHALTGLPAAWMLDRFASFRLATIYVEGDPRDVVERLELRPSPRGANVQLVGPDDPGVVAGLQEIEGLPVVAPTQAYLDLLALPERAREAAQHLRSEGLLWPC